MSGRQYARCVRRGTHCRGASRSVLWARPRGHRGGFTLIEVLLVVMILAILAISVVIPAITKYSEDAKASAFAANLRHFGRKFQLHEQQSGLYPDDEVPGVLPLEMDGEVDAAE